MVSWTVMVWVADVLLPASSVAVKVRDGVVASRIASRGFAGHFNRHLAAVVRRRGVVHGHLVEHSTVVSAGTKVNSGAVSQTVMVWVAELLFQHRRWP